MCVFCRQDGGGKIIRLVDSPGFENRGSEFVGLNGAAALQRSSVDGGGGIDGRPRNISLNEYEPMTGKRPPDPAYEPVRDREDGLSRLSANSHEHAEAVIDDELPAQPGSVAYAACDDRQPLIGSEQQLDAVPTPYLTTLIPRSASLTGQESSSASM